MSSLLFRIPSGLREARKVNTFYLLHDGEKADSQGVEKIRSRVHQNRSPDIVRLLHEISASESEGEDHRQEPKHLRSGDICCADV